MSRDLRPVYAVASGLIAAMMMSEASYWIARRFNAPDAQLFVGGYGAVLAGLAVGAAVAFWPRRMLEPDSCASCGYNLTGTQGLFRKTHETFGCRKVTRAP